MKSACAAALLALIAWSDPAQARSTDIHVQVQACAIARFDTEAFVDVLRVELAPAAVIIDAPPAPGAAPTTFDTTLDVSLPCRPDAELVTFRVATADGARVTRIMDVGDLPPAARPRGMAVVAAELVRSTTSAPAAAPAASPDAPVRTHATQTPAPPRAPTPTENPPTWDIRPAAEARIFLAVPTTVLLGGALDLHIDRARIGIGLLRGGTDDRLGSTGITLLHGSAGFTLLRFSHDRFDFAVTPRAAAGLLLVDASAKSGASSQRASEPYVDAAIELGARARLGTRAWATFDVDLGYARGLVAKADGRTAARPDGVFLGFRLGLAFAP